MMRDREPQQWLYWLLFALILFRHYVGDVLAYMLTVDKIIFRKAWFTFASGVAGIAQFMVAWKLTPWKPVQARIAVALVCCWGILEEGEVAVARLYVGLGNPTPVVPMGKGLLDVLTGLPMATMQLAIPCVIIYALVHNRWSHHDAGTVRSS